MATKWEDYTPYVNWTDNTKRPFAGASWLHIKQSSDEKLCFLEGSHGQTLTPQLPLKSFIATDLVGATFPIGGSLPHQVQCVKTDTVQTGVAPNIHAPTAVDNPASTIPKIMTLEDLLQDVLGYPSGTLLMSEDSSTGTESIPFSFDHLKQLFEVLDYPFYYNHPFRNGSNLITAMEENVQSVVLTYRYKGSTFTSATLIDGEGNDLYTPGDLNEVAPFSTQAECLTYAISKFNTLGDNWITRINPTNVGRIQGRSLFEPEEPFDDELIQISLIYQTFRFKIEQGFRFDTGQKYDYKKYLNDYYFIGASGGATESAYGTGIVDDILSLSEITEDVDGWHYIPIPAPDFSLVEHPPTTGNGNYANTISRTSTNASYVSHSVGSAAVRTRSGILLAPNQDDGTAFEYYTP